MLAKEVVSHRSLQTVAPRKYIFLRPADEAVYRLTFSVDVPRSTRQLTDCLVTVQANSCIFATIHWNSHFAHLSTVSS